MKELWMQLFFVCAEGRSQTEMLAFLFATASESEKLAKRVSRDFAGDSLLMQQA